MITDTINEKKKIPTFYKIVKCSKINNDGTADFETTDGEIIPLNYISIADTSYDTVFKSIFYKDSVDQERLKKHKENIIGKDRLKKFITELLLPSIKNGEKMKINIEYYNNEIVNYNSIYNKGTLRFDVPCKCELSIENKEKKTEEINFGVDIEMQVKYRDDVLYRFLKYNFSLENAYSQPFVVISLLNEIENKKEDNNDKENETKKNESDKESKDKKRRRW